MLKNEVAKISLNYTLSDSTFDSSQTRKIESQFKAINSPTLTELGELFADFAHLIGYSYVTGVEFVTGEDEQDFSYNDDNMNFTISTDCSDGTITLTDLEEGN